MKNLNELFYGNDYSKKLEVFNENIKKIHENYEGDFETSGYFTLLTHNKGGKVELIFDEDKNIPEELTEKILTAFRNIWK